MNNSTTPTPDQTTNVFDPDFWRNFWEELKLAYAVIRDPRTPIYLKLAPLLVLFYIFSPADLIPGIIPILGQLDDVAVLVLAVKFFLRFAPEEVVNDYRSISG